MPAAPTPAPSAPPRPPLPPANANPTGRAAISIAKAKLLGLQIIMARSLQSSPQITWGGLLIYTSWRAIGKTAFGRSFCLCRLRSRLTDCLTHVSKARDRRRLGIYRGSRLCHSNPYRIRVFDILQAGAASDATRDEDVRSF